MRTSSAAQLSFDYAASSGVHQNFAPSATFFSSDIGSRSETMAGQMGQEENILPTLGSATAAYAINARLAGRQVAAQTAPVERERLLAERRVLLDKKFDGTMTHKEQNKLTYVRWSLDRIDDAESGASLDQLEDLVSRYERVLSELDSLRVQLMQHKLLR